MAAITWGDWNYTSGNGMRIGYKVTTSSVSYSSTEVKFSVNIYTQNQFDYVNNQKLHYSGVLSGDKSYRNESGHEVVYRDTVHYKYTYYDYNKSHAIYGRATIPVTSNGSIPTVRIEMIAPARSRSGPAAPTNPVVTLNSYKHIAFSWNRKATGASPYTKQTIQAKTILATSRTGWYTIGNVSGDADTFIWAGPKRNQSYAFRIRAENGSGASAWISSNWIQMQPDAPTDVKAIRANGGQTIIVTWESLNYGSEWLSYVVDRTNDGGQTWVNVQSGEYMLDYMRYFDLNPPGTSIQYRVKVANDEEGDDSEWVLTDVVKNTVVASSPTQLDPSGVAVDFARDVEFTWQHNANDGAEQEGFQLEIFKNYTTSVFITPVINSNASIYVLPGGTLPGGIDYTWKVATKSDNGYGLSQNSYPATITAASAPSIAIRTGYPANPSTISPLVVKWNYSQTQGAKQIRWEGQLKDSSGDGLEVLAGEGTTDNAVFTYPVADTKTYTVSIRALAENGVWSNWVSKSTTISLLPPAAVTLVPTYDAPTGSMILSLLADAEESGISASIDYVDIQRRINEGDWATIIKNINLEANIDVDVLDTIPTIYGKNEYRMLIVSTEPSRSHSDIIEVITGGQIDHEYVFVSFGRAFSELLRMRYNIRITPSPKRAKSAVTLIGRDFPLAMFSRSRSYELNVAGSLYFRPDDKEPDASDIWDSNPMDWEDAELNADIVCYRDAMGRRYFGQLESVQPEIIRDGWASVSFSFARSDYEEGATTMPSSGGVDI